MWEFNTLPTYPYLPSLFLRPDDLVIVLKTSDISPALVHHNPVTSVQHHLLIFSQSATGGNITGPDSLASKPC
jgi:hypothetical protein